MCTYHQPTASSPTLFVSTLLYNTPQISTRIAKNSNTYLSKTTNLDLKCMILNVYLYYN